MTIDPLYVAARSVLLDALTALGPQRDAVIVVGAQAVYLQSGDADLTVAPYTTDADLSLAPDRLSDEPHVEDLLLDADFSLAVSSSPGSWTKTVPVDDRMVSIPVDIMVPDGVAPPGGRRGVRMAPHGHMVARRAVGLEGALIDNDVMRIAALGPHDRRIVNALVAGPAALLVAKMHKLRDRLADGNTNRIADKDAADVYRIMQAVPSDAFRERLAPLLADPRAAHPSSEALLTMFELFGAAARPGVRMAVEALRVAVPAERVEAVCASFTQAMRDLTQ